jgi:hypothetical protein
MEHVPQAELDRWLKEDPDLDFPADKDAIVASLERRGAPEAAVRAARAIPPETYENRALAVAAMPSLEDEPQDATAAGRPGKRPE